MSARAVQGEVHYCVYCHNHDGDFCSKGFPEKKGQAQNRLADHLSALWLNYVLAQGKATE